MSTLRVSGLAYFLHASLGNQLLKLIKASLTIKIICRPLKENAISYKTRKKWYQRFKFGNFNLEDDNELKESLNKSDPELAKILEVNF